MGGLVADCGQASWSSRRKQAWWARTKPEIDTQTLWAPHGLWKPLLLLTLR